MSSFQNEGLDSDVRELLNAEKPLEEPPAGVRSRVLAAVGSRIGTPDDGGKGGDGGDPVEAMPPRQAPSPVGIVRRLGPIVSSFVLGGATVTALAALRAPEVRVVYVERPPPAILASTVVPTTTASVPAVPVSALPTIEPPGRAVVASPPSLTTTMTTSGTVSTGDRLATERALLDLARAGLTNGDFDTTFVALSRHKKEFARGMLVEEREALTVKALAMAGRYAEARTKGTQFRERFPRSTMLHAVESSLESIP